MKLEYQTIKDNLVLTIEVDYNPEDNSINLEKVVAYNHRAGVDLTQIFSESPFYEVVDSIDWETIYSQKIHPEDEA